MEHPGGANEDADAFVVPLALQTVEALDVLRELTGGSEWLFPGDRNTEKQMSSSPPSFKGAGPSRLKRRDDRAWLPWACFHALA